MKSEWQFQFEARGFHFERAHKYSVKPSELIQLGNRLPEEVDCLVRIVSSDDKPPPYVEQVGSLFVTLPHSPKETRDFAFHIAAMVADRITFQQGDFRIGYGMVLCKRIAETPEEEQEFGANPYSAELSIEEIIPLPAFDSKGLTRAPSAPQHEALIAQYTGTKRDTSPIRQFLGYFRILESIYHVDKKRTPLKQVLVASEDLRGIHQLLFADASFESTISELVEVRHKCAHLKLSKGFGYVPVDPAVEHEVKPHISALATFAYYSIMGPESWR